MSAHRRALLAAAVLLSLFGCARGGIREILAQRLFTLSLGRLEDQVDLFQPDGETLVRRNRLHMRDGLFYLANGNAGKVMVFSSYGELLLLLYNPASNPPPLQIRQPADDEGTVSTRAAVPYAFQDIGEIAVSSAKTLYVEDASPPAKAARDESGDRLGRVVLRFDRRGAPLGYLGQEGVGGTPFPYIMGLHVTQRDQPVVVCRRPAFWEVFWYTREGELQYQVRIDGAHLPPPPASDLQVSVADLLPDPQEPVLHLMLYYYRAAPDPSARSSSGGGVVTRLHRFDLRTQRYDQGIELPVNPSRKERVGLKTEEIGRPPYELLGVGSEGLVYLLGYADTNLYQLVVLGPDGRSRGRAYMVIEDSELTFRDLHLSPEGIAYALLCDQSKASVSWWRSDQLATGEAR